MHSLVLRYHKMSSKTKNNATHKLFFGFCLNNLVIFWLIFQFIKYYISNSFKIGETYGKLFCGMSILNVITIVVWILKLLKFDSVLINR